MFFLQNISANINLIKIKFNETLTNKFNFFLLIKIKIKYFLFQEKKFSPCKHSTLFLFMLNYAHLTFFKNAY